MKFSANIDFLLKLFRKNFGESFWNEVIELVRAADPEVELMINDYQIVSGDASQVILKYSNSKITSKQGSLRKVTWERQ